MELDKRDITLISVLDTDARATAKQLGKAINLSPEAAARRVEKLEENGVIAQYFTQINFSKLGYSLIRFYIALQNYTPTLVEQIVTFTKKRPHIWTVYETDGEYDIAIGLLVKNLDEYYSFERDFLTAFGQYVHDKEVSTFTSLLHFPRSYLRDEHLRDRKYFEEHSQPTYEIDDVDRRMLQILATDARVSLVDLAKKLRVSTGTVQYRKKKLEDENIILAYRAHINISAIGYTYYKFDITLNTAQRIEDIRQFIHSHQNITFEDICLGGSDLEFDAEFKSPEQMQAFIEDIYTRFSGDIRTHKFYTAKKIHTYSYFPTRTPL